MILSAVTISLVVLYCIDFYYKRTSTTEDGRWRYFLFACILIVYLSSSIFCLSAKIFFRKNPVFNKRIYNGMLILAPLFMVILTELSTNKEFLHMQIQYIFLNAVIAAVFYFLMLAVCPNTRKAFRICMTVALAIGIINYYVMTYRVHPIMFSDIYSLDTAAMVIGGYHYSLANRIMLAISFYEIVIALIGATESNKAADVIQNKRKAVSFGIRVGLCMALLLSFGAWINYVDFTKAYVKKLIILTRRHPILNMDLPHHLLYFTKPLFHLRQKDIRQKQLIPF
jgi:hypothetical protein